MRIRDDFYKFHDGSTVNGATHACYNEEVGKELSSFLNGRRRSSLTADEAREFLNRIKNSKNTIISGFNKGVLAERYAASKIGKEAYRAAKEAGMGTGAAYQDAISKARLATLSTRSTINDRAAKRVAKGLGRRLLGMLPFLGAGTVLCQTGDVNAAGREAFLDLTGFDLARDAGDLLGIGYDAIKADGDAFRDRVRKSDKFRFP